MGLKTLLPLIFLLALSGLSSGKPLNNKCRNAPGDAGFPDDKAWQTLNETVGGGLAPVVPFVQFCRSLPAGECTEAQWTSGLFRSGIAGAMDMVNFEQGYDLTPPSLCFRNSTVCGQGNVPLYAVEAENVADVQAAVKFAADNNLRLAVKSSGHDLLGRSTAPNSLLIHMAKFRDMVFTDSFVVGGEDLGSALTVGPGVHLQDVFKESKAHGKIAVGGSAGTVSPAGGYLQGAGHSVISPLFGLGADNVLEFQIVVASGELLKANSVENSDLFFALRGGGAGSWGVVISATFRTFPNFNATQSVLQFAVDSNAAAGAIAGVHAKHIFALDAVRGGQYFFVIPSAELKTQTFWLQTVTANTTLEEGKALLQPFLDDALKVEGVTLIVKEFEQYVINDALYRADDTIAENSVMGSRLIPTEAYQREDAPAVVEKVYTELLDAGAGAIIGSLVAGGQVSANANISSAITPAWRTAKTHVIAATIWEDSASLSEINTYRHLFQTSHLAILEQLSGPNAGAYSNEADIYEADFQTTFFGPNYAKLTEIKAKYDPDDLFIVAAGVNSEKWDEFGMCRV
ncbi:FAD-binding domain-containing protein [Favolaschia claudopus]|uniref:FAD-binding domain-containing protein n=1 Tax=Favolaschia claudopus TaxID=2862362 RepID=A0AAW0DCX8_9AGAR